MTIDQSVEMALSVVAALLAAVAVTTQKWLVTGSAELGLWIVCLDKTCSAFSHSIAGVSVPHEASQRILAAALAMLVALLLSFAALVASVLAVFAAGGWLVIKGVTRTLAITALLAAIALVGDAGRRVQPVARPAESLGLAICAFLLLVTVLVIAVVSTLWRRRRTPAAVEVVPGAPPSLRWEGVALVLALLFHFTAALLAGLSPDQQFAHNPFACVFLLVARYSNNEMAWPAAAVLVGSAVMDTLALGLFARDTLHHGSDLERFALMLTILSLLFKPVTLGLVLYTGRRDAHLGAEAAPLLGGVGIVHPVPLASEPVDIVPDAEAVLRLSEPAVKSAVVIVVPPPATVLTNADVVATARVHATAPVHVRVAVASPVLLSMDAQPVQPPGAAVRSHVHAMPLQPPDTLELVAETPPAAVLSIMEQAVELAQESTPLGDLLLGQHDEMFHIANEGPKKRRRTAEEKAAEREQRRVSREAEILARAAQEKAALESEEARLEIARFVAAERAGQEQAARRKRELAEVAVLWGFVAPGVGPVTDEVTDAAARGVVGSVVLHRAPRARSVERAMGSKRRDVTGGRRLKAASDVEDESGGEAPAIRPGRARSFTAGGARSTSTERLMSIPAPAPRPLSRTSSRDLRHTSSTSLDAAGAVNDNEDDAAAQGRLCPQCGAMLADRIVAELHMRSHKK